VIGCAREAERRRNGILSLSSLFDQPLPAPRPTLNNHTGCSMHSKLIVGGIVVAVGVGFAAGVLAQAKPETLVQQRVSAMRLQGKYLYPLVAMAQGRVPYDGAIVSRNAGYLDVLIRMPWDGFDPSTKDVKSNALPDVYADPAKFKTAIDQMYAEMSKFQATVKTGNEANIKTAILDLNKVCNSCHDTFRQKQ
jgi:cytochrome c556